MIAMDFADKRLAQKFAAFEKEHDITLVYEALEATEAAELDLPAWDEAARKRAVSRWLRFFVGLDRNIDPQWNPKNVPVMGAPLPPSHGVVYPSGEVDPATIPDPAARAHYKQALKASKDYARHYDVQFQLRRIDESAMRAVEQLLAERYTGSPVDLQEFEELLAASELNDVRKERLRNLTKPSA